MKKLLLVIDYQYDFVAGSLGFQKAVELENVIYQKIIEYKNNQDDIIFTLDTHEDNYLNTVEGKKLPILHCIRGTSGHQLYGDVKKVVDEEMIKFEKNTFPSLELANYLKDKEYESVELCGVVSNICVLSNAVMVKSALPNVTIIIDAKATASYDDDLNEKSLDIMNGLHFDIINRD